MSRWVHRSEHGLCQGRESDRHQRHAASCTSTSFDLQREMESDRQDGPTWTNITNAPRRTSTLELLTLLLRLPSKHWRSDRVIFCKSANRQERRLLHLLVALVSHVPRFRQMKGPTFGSEPRSQLAISRAAHPPPRVLASPPCTVGFSHPRLPLLAAARRSAGGSHSAAAERCAGCLSAPARVWASAARTVACVEIKRGSVTSRTAG